MSTDCPNKDKKKHLKYNHKNKVPYTIEWKENSETENLFPFDNK